jgi:hypothetical protein
LHGAESDLFNAPIEECTKRGGLTENAMLPQIFGAALGVGEIEAFEVFDLPWSRQ